MRYLIPISVIGVIVISLLVVYFVPVIPVSASPPFYGGNCGGQGEPACNGGAQYSGSASIGFCYLGYGMLSLPHKGAYLTSPRDIMGGSIAPSCPDMH